MVLSASLPMDRPQSTVQAASTRSVPRPRLRPVHVDDFAQIVPFTAKYGFMPAETREEWEHLWFKNPAYIQTKGACPLGWVLEADGNIVGHIANFPTLYEFCGRQLVCASGRAWAVSPEYRGYSQLMLSQYLHQENVDLTLSNTANLLSYRAHLELGALPVPVGRWDLHPIWITGYTELLADWFARRRIRASRALSYPIAATLFIKDSWNRAALKSRAEPQGQIATCTAFDERFDYFWGELRARYHNKLLAVRNRLTLDWHFHSALRERRLWIITRSKGDRLLAYALFVLEKSVTAGDPIKRMLLADFQSLDRDDGVFCALLQQALLQSRREGIHLLVTIGLSASGTDASTLAPYHRPLPSSPFVYRAHHPQLSHTLANPQVWCPSLYDAEASL